MNVWLRRGLVLAVTIVLAVFTYMLLKGDGPGSGEVLVEATEDNGLNSGDVPVIAAWAVAQVSLAVLWFRG